MGCRRTPFARRKQRISYLIGIFKTLSRLHELRLADAWMHLPNSNPLFGGTTLLNYMIEGGVLAMEKVRRLVEAQAQGQ